MSESSEKHKLAAPTEIGFTLIMCSTSRYSDHIAGNKVDDSSGDYITKTLRSSNKKLVSRILIADVAEEIRNAIKDAVRNDDVSAIIICGGTGIAPQDVTIEVVTPMFDKEIPGFGELFRKLSYEEIGSPAIMSRAIAGVVDGKVIFCIPGSLNAVRLCLNNLIIPETGHILKHAREHS